MGTNYPRFSLEAAEYEYLDVTVKVKEPITFVLVMACISDISPIQWGWHPAFDLTSLPGITEFGAVMV